VNAPLVKGINDISTNRSTLRLTGVVGASGSQPVVYKFNATAGAFSLGVDILAPWFRGGSEITKTDLDVIASISDGAGWSTQNGEPYNPPELNIPMMIPTGALPADGIYYLTISGAFVPDANSTYGSLGQFNLTLEYATSADNQFAAAFRYASPPAILPRFEGPTAAPEQTLGFCTFLPCRTAFCYP
jgi:hypothetical protein